jgi:hypothetical protein
MEGLDLQAPPRFWTHDEPLRFMFIREAPGRFVRVELSEMADFEAGRRSLPLQPGWHEFMEINLRLAQDADAYGVKPTVSCFRRPVGERGRLDEVTLASARSKARAGQAPGLGWQVTTEEDVLLRSAFTRLAASAPSIVDDFFMDLLMPR